MTEPDPYSPSRALGADTPKLLALRDIYARGRYYSPAWQHYSNPEVTVVCDGCGRVGLRVSGRRFVGSLPRLCCGGGEEGAGAGESWRTGTEAYRRRCELYGGVSLKKSNPRSNHSALQACCFAFFGNECVDCSSPLSPAESSVCTRNGDLSRWGWRQGEQRVAAHSPRARCDVNKLSFTSCVPVGLPYNCSMLPTLISCGAPVPPRESSDYSHRSTTQTHNLKNLMVKGGERVFAIAASSASPLSAAVCVRNTMTHPCSILPSQRLSVLKLFS